MTKQEILDIIVKQAEELYFQHSLLVWNANKHNDWSFETTSKLLELETRRQALLDLTKTLSEVE